MMLQRAMYGIGNRMLEDDAPSSFGLVHWVALELLDQDQLKNKGYHVYMVNFCTSPALFEDLRERGFESCGTIRSEWAYLTTSGQRS